MNSTSSLQPKISGTGIVLLAAMGFLVYMFIEYLFPILKNIPQHSTITWQNTIEYLVSVMLTYCLGYFAIVASLFIMKKRKENHFGFHVTLHFFIWAFLVFFTASALLVKTYVGYTTCVL